MKRLVIFKIATIVVVISMCLAIVSRIWHAPDWVGKGCITVTILGLGVMVADCVRDIRQ